MNSIIPKQELTVIRKSQGKYFEGEWQDNGKYENDEVVFTIKASVQGSSAQTLQTLSEGQRLGEVLTLYTDSLVAIGDEIIFEGKAFLVIKVVHWKHFKSTGHYEVIITRDIHN